MNNRFRDVILVYSKFVAVVSCQFANVLLSDSYTQHYACISYGKLNWRL